ncbi:MAG TPA: LacI family DNA-binding transcriptional regulator [Acidimicrobiales bacterium]|nr:LacI family DNA-binding transcriptional regulator [Acidimicrobiales bacterium]
MSRVTIRDVADQAGVSLGTVSNVLNRPELVAASTRRRVIEVIDRIGFIRSSAAHQMRGGASRSFGAVVLDVADPFSTEILRGLEDVVHEHGSVLMLCSTDGSPEREARYLRMLEEQRVQGFVITPAGRSVRQLEELQQRGMFVVLLDRRGQKGRICSISVDHVRGGELAVGHLIGLGHRRIAFINGPLHLSHCADRRRGMRQAARRHGLDPDMSIVEYTVDPITAVSQAELAVDKLLSIPERPTAVVCVNDQIAFAVLWAFIGRGVRVPRDMSLVGHNDAEFATMLSPALTSLRLPKYELGRKAAELLIAETTDPLHRHADIRFEPELVVRESTMPRAQLKRYRPGGG